MIYSNFLTTTFFSSYFLSFCFCNSSGTLSSDEMLAKSKTVMLKEKKKVKILLRTLLFETNQNGMARVKWSN